MFLDRPLAVLYSEKGRLVRRGLSWIKISHGALKYTMEQTTADKRHPLGGENILVTGATGFTGSDLIRKLVGLGANVTAIARSSSNIDPFSGLNIHWVRGDVFDSNTVDNAVKDIAYIFHVAAAFREAKITNDVYHKVHVESTKLLAQRASDLPNFKRFIHISTVGVHSHVDHPPADENYRFKPGDIYQETKAEAELWIRDFSERRGLPLTVIRPAAIYGPGDKRLLKVFRMSRKKIFPIVGFGKCLYHLIHVDDLTDFFILAATHPKALGEIFICGNKEYIPLKDMVKTISQAYQKKVYFLRIPALPVFMLGGLCELIFRPLGLEPPIYRRRVAFYTKDRAFDTRKMRTVVNYEPKYDNTRGLKETAQWYVDQGWLA